ncbi:MAG: DegT/DnrJ/EryC1/StrS family aminotransferase [Ilumatobacteraceae bacterium]
MIPVTVVRITDEQEAAVLEVLRSGQLAQGAMVERFEAAFAEIHGVAHAITVNNGTTALIAAMKSLELSPGDEVVTSPFTFVATLNAILDAGATARFADIGDDYNMRADAAEALVSERTHSLMPVHLYGLMADMDGLASIADRHDISIVEDAAQAVGATYRGNAAGSFGVGCFSLYATKNISTGEGGVVTTNDDDVADRLRLMRNQGMRQRYQYEMAGNNYRLTNLAAAVGLPQLAQLDELNAARNANADRYREGLADIDGLILPPPTPADQTHVYHQFTVRVTNDAPIDRDQFVDALLAEGVGSGIYYPRVVFDYDCYREHPNVRVDDDVPKAFEIAKQVVSLPIHPYLSADDAATVIRSVRKVLGR